MEFWKFDLTWKFKCPIQQKMNQKEQKETTKESGLSSTIMDQSQSTTQHMNPSGLTTKRLG